MEQVKQLEKSKQTTFADLEGDLKKFYDFHGVQLLSWGFPSSVELLTQLYEILKNKTFDAGKYFQIQDNEDQETFQVISINEMKKNSKVFLIDHAVSFRYEQLRQQLQADEKLLERLSYMTKYLGQKKKIPGVTPEAKSFIEIEEFDFMEIVDPNTHKVGATCQALSFYDNKIQDIELVKQLLQKLPDLKVLWLNDNPVSELPDFREQIESSFPNIEILNSTFTKNVGEYGIKFVTYGMANLDKVKKMNAEKMKYVNFSDRQVFSKSIDCKQLLKDFPQIKQINIKEHKLEDLEQTNKFFDLLKSVPLLESLEADLEIELMLLELHKQGKLQDICPKLVYVNDHDLKLQYPPLEQEDKIRAVMKNIWQIAGCYRLASTEQYDESGIWYINDEFASAIQHSDNGNVKVVPFLYAPNNSMDDQTISYSICWPVQDIDFNDDITRDYLMGITEEQHRSSKLTTWFDVPMNFFTDAYNKFQQEKALITMKGKQLTNNFNQQPVKCEQIKDKVYKVTTDSQVVLENLKDKQFEFVQELTESDIIWLNAPISETFNQIRPDQMINQFPGESCIVMKQKLKKTIESTLGKVSWIQDTYDLNTELPRFIGDYKKRQDNHDDNIWIVKPPNMARSMDMVVTDNLDVIIRLLETGPKLAQKYIERPLTIKNKKIDLRYIVTLKSLQPLELFIYKVFWVRTSNNEFTNDYRTREIYETHFTVMNYGKSLEQIHDTQFLKLYEEEYGSQVPWEKVEQKIHRMIRDLFIACPIHEPKMNDPRCGSIYGLDVMIDLNTFEPKMLEMTFSPDCIRACKFNPSFYDDVFGLLFLNKSENDTNHIRIA